jgi:hypothetical protein
MPASPGAESVLVIVVCELSAILADQYCCLVSAGPESDLVSSPAIRYLLFDVADGAALACWSIVDLTGAGT